MRSGFAMIVVERPWKSLTCVGNATAGIALAATVRAGGTAAGVHEMRVARRMPRNARRVMSI